MNPPEKKPLTKPTLKPETQFSKKYSEFVSLIKSKAPTPKQLYSILYYTLHMRLLALLLDGDPLAKLRLRLKAVMQSEQTFRIYLSKANLERDLENVSLRDLERFLFLAIKSRLRIGSSVLSFTTFQETQTDLMNSVRELTDIKD